ncbi:MAG: cytosine permease [Thaumarchaeota archaeon]|nr:cytosine permease [Nitrososphaerota archaeon]
MSGKATEVEKLGIEHIPEEERHGSPRRVFTLWFAANLTIADYVIGVLSTVYFGFTFTQALPVLVVGNLLGGLLLGLAAAMGPSLGFPQMMASRASFGRRGNYIPGALNWVSTVGWFTVNTILAVFALQAVLPGANFAIVAVVFVGIQAIVAIYGHDFIHLFEAAMSVVLGLLFALIFVLALSHPLITSQSLSPPIPTLGQIGVLLVAAFSYLFSWSPYASDYSRYLRSGTSKRTVVVLALAGGAISSFAVEAIGALVGSETVLQTKALGFFGGLNNLLGSFGGLAMATLILGAFAANALNLYTNSLSALVLDVKARRSVTVAAGALVGLAIAVAFGERFESFFENFLLTLAYWIMPWLAIVLVDFFLARRATVERVENPKPWEIGALGTFGASVLASVPLMNLTPYGVQFEGPVSSWLGGADFSYFVSFAAAALITYALRARSRPASSP